MHYPVRNLPSIRLTPLNCIFLNLAAGDAAAFMQINKNKLSAELLPVNRALNVFV